MNKKETYELLLKQIAFRSVKSVMKCLFTAITMMLTVRR